MYQKNNWETTIPLDKKRKKDYTGSNQARLQLGAFDDDAVADSAVNYLYDKGNQSKTQSFLKNNGFPSAQDRAFNKRLYGAQEEQRQMRDLLKNRTYTIMTPKLPNENDRAFLHGLMGEKEGERDYQKQINDANRAQSDLLSTFRDTQFESSLKPSVPKRKALPEIKFETDDTPDANNGLSHTADFDDTKYARPNYSDSRTVASTSKNIAYNDEKITVAYSASASANEVKPRGSALTEEDGNVYNILQQKGQSGAATDLYFSIEEATEAYQVAGDDKGKKSIARMKAVEARKAAYSKAGKTYVDNYDYTYGKDAMVYLGVHEVALGQYHTSIIVMVSPESELYNNAIFANKDNVIEGSGIKYATIGAGPLENNLTGLVSGYLASGKNRDKDRMLNIKEDMIDLNITNPKTILNLFESEQYFQANQADYNLDYEFTPNFITNGYNSNSFTRGLLKANNISLPREPSHSVPGWNKPVPSSYFGK